MNNYVNSQDVVDYLSDKAPNLAALNLIAAGVSARAEKYCGRVFYTAQYTEYRRGVGGAQIFTAQYPIQSVAQVRIDALNIGASPVDSSGLVSPDAQGFTWDEKSVILTGGLMFYAPSGGTGKNVILQYTAGYGTTPQELPQDLYFALVYECAWRMKEITRLGLNTDFFGERGVSYVQTQDWAPLAKGTLNRYRRVYYPQ